MRKIIPILFSLSPVLAFCSAGSSGEADASKRVVPDYRTGPNLTADQVSGIEGYLAECKNRAGNLWERIAGLGKEIRRIRRKLVQGHRRGLQTKGLGFS
ncbi:MAG: hypothetical protein WCX84_02470 [Syntrophales bacterium]|jgi:hypothetical protein|nr:hypothetical protein [Syntrophales bacterium]